MHQLPIGELSLTAARPSPINSGSPRDDFNAFSTRHHFAEVACHGAQNCGPRSADASPVAVCFAPVRARSASVMNVPACGVENVTMLQSVPRPTRVNAGIASDRRRASRAEGGWWLTDEVFSWIASVTAAAFASSVRRAGYHVFDA